MRVAIVIVSTLLLTNICFANDLFSISPESFLDEQLDKEKQLMVEEYEKFISSGSVKTGGLSHASLVKCDVSPELIQSLTGYNKLLTLNTKGDVSAQGNDSLAAQVAAKAVTSDSEEYTWKRGFLYSNADNCSSIIKSQEKMSDFQGEFITVSSYEYKLKERKSSKWGVTEPYTLKNSQFIHYTYDIDAQRQVGAYAEDYSFAKNGKYKDFKITDKGLFGYGFISRTDFPKKALQVIVHSPNHAVYQVEHNLDDSKSKVYIYQNKVLTTLNRLQNGQQHGLMEDLTDGKFVGDICFEFGVMTFNKDCERF
ncbi:hypothetical protein [Vibrio sp. WXL103]|uniref:hypothetical protein n=1 Tax=Vibrio sp. WXL103 TaxID=3450710 RepID=UPI003EC5FAFE